MMAPRRELAARGFRLGVARQRTRGSIARPDQLKVAPNVETIAGRYFVLSHHLLGDGLVVREDFLVAPADEAAFGRAVDHLGRRRALTAVHTRGGHVLRLAVELRRVAGEVVVVARAVAAPRAVPLPRRLRFLPGAVALALARHRYVDARAVPAPAREPKLPGLRAAARLAVLAGLLAAAARALPEALHAVHLLLTPLALLAQHLSQLLETLEHLLLLLVGHLLLAHAVHVFRRGLQAPPRALHVLHQLAGGFLQLLVQLGHFLLRALRA